jgi:hypothetical protein
MEQTGTKGHPLVPVRVTSWDQRPVQTKRPLPAPVTTRCFRIDRHYTASLRNLAKCFGIAHRRPALITPPVAAAFSSLSLLYKNTHIFILSASLHPNLLPKHHISHIASSPPPAPSLSLSFQWRSYLDLGCTISPSKR